MIRFFSWRLAPKAAAAPKIGRGPGAAWVAGAPATTSGGGLIGEVRSTPGSLVWEEEIDCAASGLTLTANASPLAGGRICGAEALWLGIGVGLGIRLWIGLGLWLWVGFWLWLWVGLEVWLVL